MNRKPGAFIVGGAGGIGAALARKLAREGWNVAVAGRREEPLRALAEEIGGVAHPLDATDGAAVASAIASSAETFGGLEGAVNCAGSLLLKPAHLTSDAEWAAVIGANLTTAFHLLRGAVPVMKASGGSVVMVSSVAARRGLSNHEAIAAAKAGVIGLALSAAATYAPAIRVNCVAPALIRTPLTEGLLRHEAAQKASAGMHPLKRIGEPEEVASAIVWFLAPEQAWVTGQVLGVDGGLGSVQAR